MPNKTMFLASFKIPPCIEPSDITSERNGNILELMNYKFKYDYKYTTIVLIINFTSIIYI